MKYFFLLGLTIFLVGCGQDTETLPQDAATSGMQQDMTNETSQFNPDIPMEPITQLSYDIEIQGSGAEAQAGDTVSVHYVGRLQDGTQFDSSRDAGRPFSFTLGQGQVIQGWDEGVVGMKVGETRSLSIPSDMAYGANGFPPVIPPNAPLFFEVELLDIQ